MMEKLDYSALRFFWDVFQSMALLMLFLWTAIDRKRQKNSSGIKGVQDAQKKLDRRIQRLEDTQSNMPTHDDLAQVKEQIAGLSSDMKAHTNLLQTIHRYLLDKKE